MLNCLVLLKKKESCILLLLAALREISKVSFLGVFFRGGHSSDRVDIPPIEWDFHVCIHCSFASHAALHLHTLEQQAGGLML